MISFCKQKGDAAFLPGMNARGPRPQDFMAHRLKMAHPMNDATTFRMIRDSALLCTCVPPVRNVTSADRLINRILMDLSNAIGKCETVEDAQRLVWQVASREEMKS